MNLLKLAYKNLMVHKFRSIILIVTLVLVITASVIGISIQNGSQKLTTQYKEQYGVPVDIELDQKKLNGTQEAMTSLPPKITYDQYSKITKSKYVKEYSYKSEMMVTSPNAKAVAEKENEKPLFNAQLGNEGTEEVKALKFNLIGGEGKTQFTEFQQGLRKIIEGKAPKDFEVMISEDLAKLNNYKVGDKIQLTDFTGKQTHEFTISGIYEDKTQPNPKGVDMALFNKRNELITTFKSVLELNKDGIDTAMATYEIDEPENFKAFEKEVRAAGISDDYTITLDSKRYEKAMGPLDSLNSTVSYFVLIILGIAAGVLILLSILSLRERQYEVGVLRAIGMRKVKVGLNFITESIIILMIAFIVGLGIGSVVTQPIASSLLDSQVATIQKAQEDEKKEEQVDIFAIDPTKEIKTVDKIEVAITMEVIGSIVLLGFGLILLTNVINIIYIMRFQPMEIMRRRN